MMRQDGEAPATQPRLPVTVVAGFAGAGKSTLIERWLRERPATERWALLGNASTVDVSPDAGEPAACGTSVTDGAPDMARASASVGRYRVAGGCACCTAQASARSALVALLRAGPWRRLIVELDGAAHPGALVDLLRRPPFDALLEVDRIVAVIDATRPAPFEAEPMHPLARAQVEVATRIELTRADRLAEPRRAVLAGRLAAAPPFGRLVELSGAAGHEASSAGPPPRADAPLGHWCSPADQVFDRARLQALAAGWPSRHGLAQATGVFRTLRDWYLWRFDGSIASWEACAYRLENRLQWTFATGVSAQAAAASVTSINTDLGQAVNHEDDEA